MKAGIGKAHLEELHKAGISKTVGHEFVYRYPDSDDMPAMESGELAADLGKSAGTARRLAFYLHVPFCTSICGYCHYFKQPLGSKGQVQAYLDAVEKEISAYRRLIGEKVDVDSILFGGGTPTALEAEQLNRLVLFLKACFPMPKTEATIESSPETLGLEKLAMLRQNFNRLSIGVQDFNDSVLKACNRNHGKKQALLAIEDARNAGFDNVNIDLIYGLPGQGIRGWEKTLDEIEKVLPESVTASDLRVRKGTAFFAGKRQAFATEQELLEMHLMFADRMAGLGYRQVFPYQFARQGREIRFLQNQWQNREFLGFGPSSCSYIEKWDFNNVFPTASYVEAVGKNGLACAVGKKLGLEEQMVRTVALGLKDSLEGVGKKRFRGEFGMSLEERFGGTIAELEKLGLVEDNENSLKLSSLGTLFYDSVSRKFFPESEKRLC